MNEETNKLIQQLADKLGTTTEHLWLVLTKQAPISSITDTIIIAVAILSVWVSSRTLAKLIKIMDDTADDWPIAAAVVNVCVILIGISMIIYELSNFSLIVAGFFNPEYWALRQIIK